ncbi:MAG: hypothetical protein K0R26_1931 [Bacteroidota bacterium]|jgi:hypothetical protein|nr:hypothetical protein [Bacteroidota bacterium]
MNELEFKAKSINWVNHKIVLSYKSNWYKLPWRKAAMIKVNDAFAMVLRKGAKFSIGQLAVLITKNKELLHAVLPDPTNASYQTQVYILDALINEAEIIKQKYNL